MKNKLFRSIIVGLFISALTALASEEIWMTDIAAAQAQAKAENKPLLLDFTGSDWCPPCMALKSQVFSREEFIAFAKESLILVEVDFPRGKEQSPELVAHNEALAAKYEIQFFPTIILISPDGEELGRTGFRPGGADAYVEHLKSFLK
jgi:thioredoxin-related protein